MVTWPFDEAYSQLLTDEALQTPLATYRDNVKILKNKKNFASSSSGANVLSASDGIVSKGAILSSNNE